MRLRETKGDAVKQPLKLAVEGSSCGAAAVRHPGLVAGTAKAISAQRS